MKARWLSCAESPRAFFLSLMVLVGVCVCADQAAADWPEDPVEGLVSVTADQGRNAAVGMDALGRFIACYERPRPYPAVGRDIWVMRFANNGVGIGEPTLLTDPIDEDNSDLHSLPSLAMSGDSDVYVAWIGNRYWEGYPSTMVLNAFDFDLSPFEPPLMRPPGMGGIMHDFEPSIGQRQGAAWSSDLLVLPRGLLYGVGGGVVLPPLRECGPYGGGDVCFNEENLDQPTAWQPAMCQRDDGMMAMVFADAETPNWEFSFFDIHLMLFQSDGSPIGEVLVSNPIIEQSPSIQRSAAVALDSWGHLVVVWVGPNLEDCPTALAHIYARRYFWDAPYLYAAPEGVLRIDNAPDAAPIDAKNANPTVALLQTENENEAGAYVVAWNAQILGRTWHNEVHAQAVDRNGMPVGQEFRVNQSTDNTGEGTNARRLANSAQHTLQYGPDGQIVAVWTAYSAVYPSLVAADVHFTLLPPGYAESVAIPCCKADIDDNGLRNGLDVQPFVDLLLSHATCLDITAWCRADTNEDDAVDLNDIPSFVQYLLEGATCQDKSISGGDDCNGNQVNDLADIGAGNSEDCNGNFVPDECDIAAETSADANSNGIPDECDPDCNGNDVPDDWDITQETSADIDSNGVPDECQPDCNKNDVPDYWDIDPQDPDGNELVSADCNENGVPDECEPDCNANGVPDDCDIDPSDPDGDEWVSPDCNENEYPDECEIALGPGFGSTDCNDNDIPDECDISDCDPEDPDCQDCNENGYPDSCDIAAEISLDEDENGIPDECEGGGDDFAGGTPTPPDEGEGFAGGTPTLPGDPEAYFDAWIEYYEWLDEQDWGPDSELTGAEQFQLMVDKLKELGLPIQSP